jgi:two-component system sensor kinase FixL
VTPADHTSEPPHRRLDELEAQLAELRRSRDAERRQAEMLGVTLASISDPVFITDEAGAFTYVCPNVEVALGYSAAEVEHMAGVESLLGDRLVSADKLRSRGEIANIEHRAATKFGEPRDLLINVKHISIGEGRALYVCRDITERKKAQERARRLREELTHVARVATLGELAAGLAHELNQPLTAIANYANGCKRLLAAERASPQELAGVLATIATEAERAGQIVHRLRRLVRQGVARRQDADLNAAVRDVVSLARHEAERLGVELRLSLAVEPLLASMDPVQIQQVVLNLVRNGCDALADETTHRIVEITSRRRDREVELSVCDTGPGVAPDVADRLFDPFFTTKGEGIGMGLTISRSIVEDHGGRLSWRANEPRGACFTFTLPAPGEERG